MFPLVGGEGGQAVVCHIQVIQGLHVSRHISTSASESLIAPQLLEMIKGDDERRVGIIQYLQGCDG